MFNLKITLFPRFSNRLKDNRYLIMFMLSFAVGFVVNTINIDFLTSNFPDKVRLDQTILTSDDLVYLKPIKNLLHSGVWTDGSIGRQQYFSRPPGYSLFILPFYYLFGIQKGLFYVKIAQLLLFALSTTCLFRLIERIFHSIKSSFICSLIYGVFPIASGFVFYTLTEAISPAILIFYLYYLHKGWRMSCYRSFGIAALFLAFLLLVRPVFAMFILPLIILSFLSGETEVSWWRRFRNVFLYSVISLLPLLIWEIRVVHICKEFPGLYPVYDKEVNTIYRPTHRAIWDFGKCWGISGKDFHAHIGPIWEQAIYPDSISGDPINTFISIIPKHICEDIGVERIRSAFLAYQANVGMQKTSYLNTTKLPTQFYKQEKSVVLIFDSFTKNYQAKHWFRYYVIVPCIYLKEMSFHSNLNLYIYQHYWRGNVAMEITRVISLFIHFAVFLLLFLSFFQRKISIFTRLLAISALIYVLFLACYFRELEERYTLPILPVLFIVAIEVIIHSSCFLYVKSKFRKV